MSKTLLAFAFSLLIAAAMGPDKAAGSCGASMLMPANH